MAAKLRFPAADEDPLVRGDVWTIPVAFREGNTNQDPTSWTFADVVLRREPDSEVIATFTQSIDSSTYLDENDVPITALVLTLAAVDSALAKDGDVFDVRRTDGGNDDWVICTGVRVDKDVSHV